MRLLRIGEQPIWAPEETEVAYRWARNNRKFLPSNNPLSLNLSSGMSNKAKNESVIYGAESVELTSFSLGMFIIRAKHHPIWIFIQ